MYASRQEITASPFDNDIEPATLIELLQYRASHQPEQVAYTFLDDFAVPSATLTYREVDQRARAIAATLQQMNAVNEKVLLLYTAGLEFHVAFLGCLYAGAIAVPAYPPKMNRTLERLRAVIADAEARIILTTSRILSRLPSAEQLFDLKSFQWLATDDVQTDSEEWHDPRTASSALAFLQYTSGSTGTARGVRLTHANLLHNARLVYEAVEHSPGDKYVSWLPTFHDMGFMAGVLQPLYAGIPAVLLSPTSFLQSPWLWLHAISAHKATISGGPNFAYRLCVTHVSPEQRAALNLESWTVAFNGAEPIHAQTLDDFAATFAPHGFDKQAFYPCYGLAEATLMVSGGRKNDVPIQKRFSETALGQHRVLEAGVQDHDSRTLVSCGRALGGQRIAIVDPVSETICRSDEVGEIWISGPSVADGYWGQTEQSKSVFGAHIKPTGEGPFLRTGDLGFLQHGELYITGRLKDLIIIRGANYYPHDIELTVQKSHPVLRAGCGAAFSVEIDGAERLVVVQEVDKQKTLDGDDLVALIRRDISREHELQAHSIVLIKKGTIPKTSSGKIQRYACKAAFLSGALDEVARDTLDNSEAPPEEPSFILKALRSLPADSRQPLLEVYVQEQVARVLKSPASRLKNDCSLATFGLDSLNAVEFKNAIERDMRVEISLPQILGEASIRDLAQEMLWQIDAPVLAERDVGQATIQVNEFPLSYMQQALWLIHQLAPASGAYNVALAIQIVSPLDREALFQALQDVVNRHASLRTTFAIREEQPIQIIHQHHELNVEEIDATKWDDQKLNEKLGESAHQPFDLERGPVFRATLFNRSVQDHILLLAAHHIVTDGWSMWVLLDEVTRLYEARKLGTMDTRPLRFAEYSKFVRWQAETLDGAEGEMLWSYWQKELAQLPTLDFPTTRQRPPVFSFKGDERRFLIDRECAQELRRLAAANHTTLYVVLLSVFKVLLQRYTGVEDLVVGSPLYARPKPEFEGTLGCFFNAVALRSDFSNDPSFTELLAQTRRKVLCAFEHQQYPSHLLAEKLLLERDPSRPHLFQATFILQKPIGLRRGARFHLGDDGLYGDLGDLQIKLLPVGKRFARNDLELEMFEAEDGLFGSLQFNTDLFRSEDVARMALHYQQLLRAVVATPGKRISQLQMISEAERAQILGEWSSSGRDYSQPTTVSALLDEQVSKTPEKVVALYGETALTYSQLNDQAGRLANLIERLKK